jgi:3-hydroxyacyl-CoA dehydrogenase
MSMHHDVVTLAVTDEVAVITADSPPVNALGIGVRRGLEVAFRQALEHEAVKAVILMCTGRTFFAGADINEFGKPIESPELSAIVSRIDNFPKPTVAAIHGTALGGGLEIALGCLVRIAVPSAKLGLPEVNLGLLPGAGGTQRLPRIIGVAPALEMILSGQNKLREDAIAFGRELAGAGVLPRRARDREDKMGAASSDSALFTAAQAKLPRGFKAPANILKAVRAAAELPFEEGLKREGELFLELLKSKESAAQRHVFFAERAAAKIPGIGADTPVVDIAAVGVIGAGTMGGGIAMNFLNIGVPVTLMDNSREALERGIAIIRRNYQMTAEKGRISAAEVENRMARLTPTLEFSDFDRQDLLIEAVFENLELKKNVFAQLDRAGKPGAILASNTSFLDLNALAAATARPAQVVGMHFFSPANVMRLLEVVRGEKTSKTVIASTMRLGRRIGKLAVLSGVCPGFIANRVMALRSKQADALLLEGALPWDVDRVLVQFGFPMGPFAMMDLVGLDVIGWDRQNSAGRTVQEVLCEMDRWGQKKGAGYYDYDPQRRATPSPVAEAVIREFARAHGIVRRDVPDGEILERLLYPVVNEGAKILEEGIALRAGDIDVALIGGYGWPVYTGGPMFWGETVGLAHIVRRLQALRADHGDFFEPAPLLERLAREVRGFAHG